MTKAEKTPRVLGYGLWSFLRHSSFAICHFPLLLAGFLFAGCAGYHLGPAKPSYLQNIRRIAVPTFRNDTLEPRLEALITGTVVKQFHQDGTYEITSYDGRGSGGPSLVASSSAEDRDKIAAAASGADAVLEGTIERVVRTPTRSVRGNVLLTREFTLTVGLRYRLVERATGKVLDVGHAQGQTNFFIGGDPTQEQRQAVPLAAERAAIRLVSQLTEGF